MFELLDPGAEVLRRVRKGLRRHAVGGGQLAVHLHDRVRDVLDHNGLRLRHRHERCAVVALERAAGGFVVLGLLLQHGQPRLDGQPEREQPADRARQRHGHRRRAQAEAAHRSQSQHSSFLHKDVETRDLRPLSIKIRKIQVKTKDLLYRSIRSFAARAPSEERVFPWSCRLGAVSRSAEEEGPFPPSSGPARPQD